MRVRVSVFAVVVGFTAVVVVDDGAFDVSLPAPSAPLAQSWQRLLADVFK